MALIAGALFFLYQIQKNKIKFLLTILPLALLIFLSWLFLKNTSYIATLSPRTEVWNIAITTFMHNPKTILFGYGLKSYIEAAWIYFPANMPAASFNAYRAHSFYLYNMVEMGLVGTGLIILFFIKNIFVAFKNLVSRNKILVALGIGVISIFISIFIEGTFDMPFNSFLFRLWLFFILGVMYAKIN